MMGNSVTGATPTWVKIVAVVGVVWYAFGLVQCVLAYTMDVAGAVEAGKITAAHGDAISATSMVVWIAFAIASGAGLIGSALLFGRSPAAKTLFLVSLASAAVYYVWTYAISGTGGDRPTEDAIIGTVVGVVTLIYYLIARRVA